jgi:hypothetical protein
MPQRLRVIGLGIILGAMFALWVAGPFVGSGVSVDERARLWLAVMSGPLIGSWMGLMNYAPPVCAGWLGLFLIAAHPLRPSRLTAFITILGLLVWFFAGFFTVAVAVFSG